jgi:hypothetical protein
VRIEDAIELLLQQNQLHQKVVNDNTLLIYPDSPQKLKDYQELVMRTFYLTNTDSNTALNMIKTMLKTRDVFIDERLNTLTMRDTPKMPIRMAEKLLQSLRISPIRRWCWRWRSWKSPRQRILDLGLQWPNTFGVINSDGTPVQLLLIQLKGINSSRISISPSPQAENQCSGQRRQHPGQSDHSRQQPGTGPYPHRSACADHQCHVSAFHPRPGDHRKHHLPGRRSEAGGDNRSSTWTTKWRSRLPWK